MSRCNLIRDGDTVANACEMMQECLIYKYRNHPGIIRLGPDCGWRLERLRAEEAEVREEK